MKSNLSSIINITSQYSRYHVEEIVNNRFTHKLFMGALQVFENAKQLSIKTIGSSQESRIIKSITFGTGKIKVLLWSQMHGNESTATRAILDILRFLIADDEFNPFRLQIAQKLTLQFIPMLNPDGTEHFQRRTATEIDMNRDAVQLQTPEGRLLMNVVDKFKPEFALNLHDQRRFYNVKNTGVPSSISFLAPAYNESRDVNTSRKQAMQLIAGINKTLQNYIPDGVGLYDDTYSYRSFGDCIQSKGISTILVESGWLPQDMEKESVRKLNFTALLTAFKIISTNNFKDYSVKDYEAIPAIDNKLFDILIKNTSINVNSKSKVDIGISRAEYLIEHPNYYSVGQINDLGDLTSFYGFETIDAKELTVVEGKAKAIQNLQDISMVSVKRLLKQGILFLITENIPLEKHVPFPINIVHPRKLAQVREMKFEGTANFLLIDKHKTIKYIILNGFVIKPNEINVSVNGLVLV